MNNRTTILVIAATVSLVIVTAILVGQLPSSAIAASPYMDNSSGQEQIAMSDEAHWKNQTQVVKQGTLSSPGEVAGPFQVIDILPAREDGNVYVGSITFTATKPIFVAPIQTFGVANETLDSTFGDLIVFPGGPNGTLISPAIITPQYSAPIESQIPIPETYSASVPFAGNGLAVGNLNGERFLISYTLEARVYVPEIEDDVQSAVTSQPEVNGTGVSIVMGAAGLNDTAYSPNPVRISVGENVTWVNNDLDGHTVTSMNFTSGDVGVEFDSSYMGLHRTFTHQFDEEGEFDYFCMLHPNMVGKVIVE